MRFVPDILLQLFLQDEQIKRLQNILGFTPGTVALYELAFCHSSFRESTEYATDNERLEFLGDAILGATVSEYLYKKYPTQPEGFLTEMRSKIVNRVTLNKIAVKLGLKEILKYNKQDNFLRTSQIFGNALEALIGAIYLDKGHNVCRKFIKDKILSIHIDLENLELEDANLKNKLIGWANKNKRKISFELINEKVTGMKRTFTIGVYLDGEIICEAEAYNKKEASKRAAGKAIEKLQISEG